MRRTTTSAHSEGGREGGREGKEEEGRELSGGGAPALPALPSHPQQGRHRTLHVHPH